MAADNINQEIRVRIAPSPSGHLHVGTARTAVYNWLFARKHGGTFILRIEDTDQSRSFAEMTESIMDSLKWLGLDWDEGPYFQSKRTELYQQAADRLLEQGRAYYCYCMREELEARRTEAMAAGRNPLYNRCCRRLTAEQRAAREAEGREKVMRIAIPENGTTTFEDLVLGPLTKGNDELDDFIILRADWNPTYNFVCAVDDVEMRISHVIRGNDHVTNTFKQVLVYRALDATPPYFAHLPLILGQDKKKISKRQGAVAVTEYRDQGYLPEAFMNFLALLGWSPGDDREYLPRTELIAAFGLERVTSTNPVFDTDKLTWLNGQYIRDMDDNKLLTLLQPILMEAGLATRLEIETRWHWMLKIIHSLKERLHFLTDIIAMGAFYFRGEFGYEEQGVAKYFRKDGTSEILTALADEFAKIPEERFNQESSEQALRALAESRGAKVAQLIHPLRLALTGSTKGPGMFEITDILGRDNCLKRIARSLEYIKTLGPPE
jgi:glutamyl-tRNA synthetase